MFPMFYKSDIDTLGSFKLQFSLGFATSCYVIMNTSIAWTLDKLKITLQDVMKPRENFNLKEGIVYMFTLFAFSLYFQWSYVFK